MLSIFPDLLTFWLLAPFILRVTAGLIFIYFGYRKLFRMRMKNMHVFHKLGFGSGAVALWTLALTEIAGGALLTIGLFTQATALALLLISIGALMVKLRSPRLLENTVLFYILLSAVLLSLLVLGPGFFAIDLPL